MVVRAVKLNGRNITYFEKLQTVTMSRLKNAFTFRKNASKRV